MSSRTLARLCALALPLGCDRSDTDTGAGDTQTDATTASSTGESLDPCVPVADFQDQCPVPLLCGSARVEGYCTLASSDWTLSGDPPCILSALRDGGPGLFSIDIDTSPVNQGPCFHTDYITLLGDGTAVMTRLAGHPDNLYADGPFHVQVREPAYFEACLQSSDPAIVAPCLADWFVEKTCAPELCCPSSNPLGYPLCGSG